jgi:hypothetical protein
MPIMSSRKDDSKVPQVMPMPTPPRMPTAKTPSPEYYDPEVLRVVQADYDRKRKIAELEQDRDDWRRQALDAKREIERIEMQLDRQQKEHDAALRGERHEHETAVTKLEQARDYWRDETNRIKTCAQAGAAVFLQILSTDAEDKPPASTAADRAILAGMADALESGQRFGPDEAIKSPLDVHGRVAEAEPLPKVVRDGPVSTPPLGMFEEETRGHE